MPSTTPPSAAPAHDERLWPGPLGWSLVGLAGLSVAGALAPAVPVAALWAGLGTLLVGCVAAVALSPRVAVAGGELVAGPAHVPVRLLAAPRALEPDERRRALGPDLDARAFGVLRSWIPCVVRVDVRDPADPTPYWIVSTRRPDRLVDALLAQGAAPS